MKIRRKCPFCDRFFYLGLWKHIYNSHPDNGLSDKEIVVKILGLTEIPKCANPRCNNEAVFNRKEYKFQQYCCINCNASHHTQLKWMNPEYRERHTQMMSNMVKNLWDNDPDWRERRRETSSRAMSEVVKRIWNDPEYRKAQSIRASERLSNLWKDPNFRELRIAEVKERNYEIIRSKRSIVEISFCNRLIRLLPECTILNNQHIGSYFPDILIKELNLIIEIDGSQHNDSIEYDINKDKFLYSKGYKVRRLDASICKSISDTELVDLVFRESKLELPYFERIPIESFLLWKKHIDLVDLQ